MVAVSHRKKAIETGGNNLYAALATIKLPDQMSAARVANDMPMRTCFSDRGFMQGR